MVSRLLLRLRRGTKEKQTQKTILGLVEKCDEEKISYDRFLKLPIR
jgi:hypothetical protein